MARLSVTEGQYRLVRGPFYRDPYGHRSASMWKASAPVVVGVDGSDALNAIQIIGPHSHPLVAHGDCSVLVVH